MKNTYTNLKSKTPPKIKNCFVLGLCRGLYKHRTHHWAADPWQNQGIFSLVLARIFLWLSGSSWYILFLVILPEYSSDVRSSLGSTYLLDVPLLGLHKIWN